MFKNHLLHGLTAGILSGVACYVFYILLKDEFMYDFSEIISSMNLFGACIFGCLLASLGYYSSLKVLPTKYGEIVDEKYFIPDFDTKIKEVVLFFEDEQNNFFSANNHPKINLFINELIGESGLNFNQTLILTKKH